MGNRSGVDLSLIAWSVPRSGAVSALWRDQVQRVGEKIRWAESLAWWNGKMMECSIDIGRPGYNPPRNGLTMRKSWNGWGCQARLQKQEESEDWWRTFDMYDVASSRYRVGGSLVRETVFTDTWEALMTNRVWIWLFFAYSVPVVEWWCIASSQSTFLFPTVW